MKAEKTRYHVNRCTYADESISEWDYEEIDAELKELERLATEYQSPETQRLIELGKAVEKAFEELGCIEAGESYDPSVWSDSKELLKWYREQDGK